LNNGVVIIVLNFFSHFGKGSIINIVLIFYIVFILFKLVIFGRDVTEMVATNE